MEIVVRGCSRNPLQPIQITERGALRRIHGLGAVTNLPSHIPQRMTNRVRNLLNETGLDANLEARQRAIPAVEEIINAEMMCLRARLHELSIRPLIADLHRKAECIRQQEMERTLKYLGDIDAATLSHIQHLSASLVKKLLHEPTLLLRQKAQEGSADPYVSTMRDLFGLEARSS